MMLHPLEHFEEPRENMNDFGEQVFNGLAPQNNIPPEDDLEYVDPAEHGPQNEKYLGEEKVMQSADSVMSNDGNVNDLTLYPMEYLNSLKASNLPLAKLALKIGVPVMLLRNLDTTKGLCNGTRMIVTHISTRVLRCQIISGDAKFAGSIVLIPRINMDVSEEDLPIPLKHIKKDCKYCLSGNPEWFTNHLMSIAGPCSIDIGLQIISNIYQWTL
ncbi:hypothetical protein E4T56_gene14504 [Termitomyces sp. T112]|nr:hypothetical protein E4T56_gene14504 [Termitomyces sp. T112]